jgi:hypothetical protein
MGVTVTFMAILELVREGLIEIVQAEPFAPIHVRAAGASRKLHVVGGSEALIGEGVVLNEAVVGDAPAIGVIAAPADLESLTELVLDPNFVDDDDEQEEEGFLEGVDDVVNEPSPAPAPEVALADAGSTPPAVEPTSVVDEWTAAVAPFALVGAAAGLPEAADVVAGPAAGLLEAADVTFAPVFDPASSSAAGREPQFATDVVAASVEFALADVPPPHLAPVNEWAASVDLGASAAVTFEPAASHDVGAVVELAPSPVAEWAASVDLRASDAVTFEAVASHEVGAVVELAPSPVATEPVLAADVVGAAVESVLVAEPVNVAFSPAVDGVPSSAADVELATDVVAASVESAPVDVPLPHLAPGDELAANVDLSESAADTFESTAESHEVGAAVESVMADLPAPVEAGAVVELAPVHDPATAELQQAVVDLAAAQVDVPASAHELASSLVANEPSALDVPSLLIDEPSVSAGPAGDEIAVTLEPSLTILTVAADATSLGADVSPAADPAPAMDESAVTVDPAVFDAPAVTAESEQPSGTPPEEEPPTVDVEYELSAEDLAAAERVDSDDDVSFVGDTSVVGDVSLVGEESVSGGPAVEVEEFAFDELPALDEAEHADQQPAAGAQTEESDD